MKPADLFALVQRLNGPMEALGALAAELRAQTEGLSLDPAVHAAIGDVLSSLGVDRDALAALPRDAKVAAAGGIVAFLRQSVDVAENPAKAPGWTFTDPDFLQNQGRMSMSVADVVRLVAPGLSDLAARLDGGRASFLDVGTGVGWLAIAMAKRFPGLSVVGLDTFAPAIAVGRENVAREGLADRIELRQEDVTALADRDRYDLAFVASPFLRDDIVRTAIERTRAALGPGGVLLFGTFATVDDPVARATQALRIVRSGGRPWELEEARALLESAGFASARVLERTWTAPIAFAAGVRPT